MEKETMAEIENKPEDDSKRTLPLAIYSEKILPWVVVFLLCLFIVTSSLSAYDLAVTSERGSSRNHLYEMLPFIIFVMLALAYSGWFISCFTGDLTREKTRQIFRFAYAFTITAFVILMTPVANPWQPDVIGPISLLRGCVLAPVGEESSVPGAIRCARGETAFLPESVRQDFVQSTQKPSDNPVPAIRCSDAEKTTELCVESDSYPWLVTLGGFNGVVVHNGPLLNGKQPDDSKPSDKTVGIEPNEARPFVVRTSIIQGGFVVPFYVVLLAFIGGAVSLARRIPEYQKRSVKGYVPSPKQPALMDLEVREVVVFQVMQLISAPLIAVVAFYALSPSTMSSAIGLAFLSGFASELILLQIRGVVEGLQPHVTAVTNPANEPKSSPSSQPDTPAPDPTDDIGKKVPTSEDMGNVASPDTSVSEPEPEQGQGQAKEQG
jgi:hypothetical protein